MKFRTTYRSTFMVLAFFGLGSVAGAEQKFRKLTGPQIQTTIAGMELSDNVHWRDFYARDGTFKSSSMGLNRAGKWWIKGNELCVDRGKEDGGCYEIWLSGSKMEFRRPGMDMPYLE